MKLLRIKLNNFRQFYGSQTLVISSDPEKNVTLIHAENGIGKTTLLNSILWCFYGEVTKKFEKADQILNFQAAGEGETLASVEVTFEHDGREYQMLRRASCHNSGKKPEQSLMAYQIQRGVYQQIEAAETFINSVVPREMARYYFFDGEHAETFSSETNYRAVGQAIRNMLGCNLVETAIEDLEHAVKTLNQLIGDIPGDSEVQEVTRRLKEFDDRRTQLKDQLNAKTEEREVVQEQIDAILQKLRDAEGAKQLQELRDEKGRQLQNIEEQLKSAEQAIVRWLGTRTLPLIARRLTKETLDFIDEQSLRGRIPSPYNEDFVKGLLASEICICERPLIPASAEWRAVTDLLKEASTAVLLGRVVRARSRILMLREAHADAPKVLEAEQARTARLMERRRELEQQIGELSNKIKDLPIKEIAEREQARQELSHRLTNIDQTVGALKVRLVQLEQMIKDTQAHLDKIASKSVKARKLIGRRDLAERSAELLGKILEQHESEARRRIAELVNSVLDYTARREYRFQFRETFAMDLTFPDGRPVPRSSGENQLVTLAFIAALIQFSVERAKRPDELLIPGIVAPLVLDSPFGQLDAKYRVDTAKFVPKMASQIVLLVSSSQGDQSVLQALQPNIGKEYVLISENKGPRGARSDDVIVLNGTRIATSLFNCAKDLARIEEVKHANIQAR